jgi:hypothetical protein
VDGNLLLNPMERIVLHQPSAGAEDLREAKRRARESLKPRAQAVVPLVDVADAQRRLPLLKRKNNRVEQSRRKSKKMISFNDLYLSNTKNNIRVLRI